jgi:kelch-like protein 1/4/5
VVLVVGGRRIAAHRVLLSAASDYFAAMFTSDVSSEARQEEVKIHDVDPAAMETLVHYMYTGQSQTQAPTAL